LRTTQVEEIDALSISQLAGAGGGTQACGAADQRSIQITTPAQALLKGRGSALQKRHHRSPRQEKRWHSWLFSFPPSHSFALVVIALTRQELGEEAAADVIAPRLVEWSTTATVDPVTQP
jgi:hypothetical protein